MIMPIKLQGDFNTKATCLLQKKILKIWRKAIAKLWKLWYYASRKEINGTNVILYKGRREFRLS